VSSYIGEDAAQQAIGSNKPNFWTCVQQLHESNFVIPTSYILLNVHKLFPTTISLDLWPVRELGCMSANIVAAATLDVVHKQLKTPKDHKTAIRYMILFSSLNAFILMEKK
jgi:hypothetical protein